MCWGRPTLRAAVARSGDRPHRCCGLRGRMSKRAGNTRSWRHRRIRDGRLGSDGRREAARGGRPDRRDRGRRARRDRLSGRPGARGPRRDRARARPASGGPHRGVLPRQHAPRPPRLLRGSGVRADDDASLGPLACAGAPVGRASAHRLGRGLGRRDGRRRPARAGDPRGGGPVRAARRAPGRGRPARAVAGPHRPRRLGGRVRARGGFRRSGGDRPRAPAPRRRGRCGPPRRGGALDRARAGARRRDRNGALPPEARRARRRSLGARAARRPPAAHRHPQGRRPLHAGRRPGSRPGPAARVRDQRAGCVPLRLPAAARRRREDRPARRRGADHARHGGPGGARGRGAGAAPGARAGAARCRRPAAEGVHVPLHDEPGRRLPARPAARIAVLHRRDRLLRPRLQVRPAARRGARGPRPRHPAAVDVGFLSPARFAAAR